MKKKMELFLKLFNDIADLALVCAYWIQFAEFLKSCEIGYQSKNKYVKFRGFSLYTSCPVCGGTGVYVGLGELDGNIHSIYNKLACPRCGGLGLFNVNEY